MYQKYNTKQKNNLDKFSDLTKEFITTGMEVLIERINSKVILRTDLASYLLFRQIMEAGDAISELIKIGCINSAKPLLRTLLECYFQFSYLLKDDSERKSLQFLYHNEIKKRNYYENLAYPDKAGSYHQRLKNDKHLKEMDISQDQKEVYIENIRKIDEVINSREYEEIKSEYDNAKSRNGKAYKIKYWYELFNGPKNAEGIMIELEESALYEFIYRDCSGYAHGEDIVHINLESTGEDTFGISELRDLRQLSIVANNVIMLIERSCLLFVKNKVENTKTAAEKFFPMVQRAQEYREL